MCKWLVFVCCDVYTKCCRWVALRGVVGEGGVWRSCYLREMMLRYLITATMACVESKTIGIGVLWVISF